MSEQNSLNENNKPYSKVLRPPGGGSSDIFGADVPSTPRSVKNYMQSNIFSCEKGSMKNNGDQQRRAQKKEDSYSRLFGDPERPFTPAKNHMKSNIPFGGNAAVVASKNGSTASNGNGHNASNGRNGKLENGELSSTASSVSSSSENLKMNGFSKTEAGDASAISSPRPNAENNNPKQNKTEIINESLSARSNSSNISEKTHTNETSPQIATINGTEETSSEVTTSTSLSQKTSSATSVTSGSQKTTPRNPITGLGLGDDGQRFRRNINRRDGNPVTGEGYKPAGAEINTTIPSLNGANQVINKNRIPPGGFSSGLW